MCGKKNKAVYPHIQSRAGFLPETVEVGRFRNSEEEDVSFVLLNVCKLRNNVCWTEVFLRSLEPEKGLV